jgi:hypothetical protein
MVFVICGYDHEDEDYKVMHAKPFAKKLAEQI